MTTVISITGIITEVLLNNDLNIILTIEYKFILFRNYSNSLSLLISRNFYSIKTCKHGDTVK